MFDLFELHDPKYDTRSRGWIRFGGTRLIKEAQNIFTEVSNSYGSMRQISILLSRDLKISYHTIYKYLMEIKNDKWYSKKNCIPLPILKSLINTMSLKNQEKRKWKIINATEFLVTGAPRSKPVKAVHFLTHELAKIAGAHAADGTLVMAESGSNSHMYRWVVTDGNIYSLSSLQKWVKSSFGINIKIKKSPYDNSFLFIVDNKVITRYLNRFFGFKFGDKTKVATIPKIINKSSFKFKRNFALGVLTFDGSIDLDGNLRLNIKSNKLLSSVADIMQKDGLKITFPKTTKKRGWTLKCKISENGRDVLNYFDKDSVNWRKAYGFLYGFNKNEAIQLFKRTPISKITLRKFIETQKRLNTSNKRMLAKNLGVNIRTIRKYTNLCKLIKS